MLVESTSIPLRNLQSSPPASCHVCKSKVLLELELPEGCGGCGVHT